MDIFFYVVGLITCILSVVGLLTLAACKFGDYHSGDLPSQRLRRRVEEIEGRVRGFASGAKNLLDGHYSYIDELRQRVAKLECAPAGCKRLDDLEDRAAVFNTFIGDLGHRVAKLEVRKGAK